MPPAHHPSRRSVSLERSRNSSCYKGCQSRVTCNPDRILCLYLNDSAPLYKSTLSLLCIQLVAMLFVGGRSAPGRTRRPTSRSSRWSVRRSTIQTLHQRFGYIFRCAGKFYFSFHFHNNTFYQILLLDQERAAYDSFKEVVLNNNCKGGFPKKETSVWFGGGRGGRGELSRGLQLILVFFSGAQPHNWFFFNNLKTCLSQCF